MKVQNNLFVFKIFILLVIGSVLFATIPGVKSAVQTLSIEDTIGEDLTVYESIIISSRAQAQIDIKLPQNAHDISFNGTILKNNSVSVPACSVCSNKLNYSLSSAARKLSPEQFEYVRTLSFPITPSSLQYTVKLPIGYILDEERAPIVPAPSKITTDGKYIIVVWNITNPSLPQVYSIHYFNHENTEGVREEIRNELSEFYFIGGIILFLIVGITIGFFVSKIFFKNNNKHKIKVSVPSSLLSPDEKKIIKQLSEEKGESTQKELSKKLTWSKSKTSAVLSTLEYKEMIKREKIGRTYKVVLLKNMDQ